MTAEPVDGDLVESPPKVEVPADVAEAVRTLIRWAGDDPDREGLLDTPARVGRAAIVPQSPICVSLRVVPSTHVRPGSRSYIRT